MDKTNTTAIQRATAATAALLDWNMNLCQSELAWLLSGKSYKPTREVKLSGVTEDDIRETVKVIATLTGAVHNDMSLHATGLFPLKLTERIELVAALRGEQDILKIQLADFGIAETPADAS
jgi:hypothetical protein